MSKHDLESYVTLKAMQTYKLRKDTEHAVIDWHNGITLPEDMPQSIWFSSATVTTTTTNACVEMQLDYYFEDLLDEEAELATLDLHHQYDLSIQVPNTVGQRGNYQNQGAFSLDSS